jgi:hypothetical protein
MPTRVELPFADRRAAAAQLAAALAHLAAAHPLVLAIPRGAVPMGRIIADALRGELDVVLVRKLRAPFHAEFAVGAIDESGWTYVSEHAPLAGADHAYLDQECARQLALIRQRRQLYTPARGPLPARGRVVIVVDDGLATGSTMIAALHSARARHPQRLVCAIPVAAPDSLDRVRPLADEVVCLAAPEAFQAVGQYYERFPAVEDSEVVATLAARATRGT